MEILIFRKSLFQKTKTGKSKIGVRSFSNKKNRTVGDYLKNDKIVQREKTVCRMAFAWIFKSVKMDAICGEKKDLIFGL